MFESLLKVFALLCLRSLPYKALWQKEQENSVYCRHHNRELGIKQFEERCPDLLGTGDSREGKGSGNEGSASLLFFSKFQPKLRIFTAAPMTKSSAFVNMLTRLCPGLCHVFCMIRRVFLYRQQWGFCCF